jgi:MoxR-like ATPase
VLKSIQNIIEQTSTVFLDKHEAVKLSVVCLLADGHLLIEDVPGVGKTTLVQTLGQLLGLKTHRIQFTIDLLPADILGGNIYNPKTQEFNFFPGPLFAQLILADELNRASPRTQSALLQAMEEMTVSIDGFDHILPRPFFVIATQNPHHNIGTFPLPESQLDRFLMSLELDYASRETEKRIFQMKSARERMAQLKPVMEMTELIQIQKHIEGLKLSDVVADYVSLLLENSRKESTLGEALSTRCGVSLIRAAKAWAFLESRDYVKPDDIQKVFIPIAGHRLGGKSGVSQGRAWAKSILEMTATPR